LIVLLSTSDTDLLSARASGAAYRLASGGAGWPEVVASDDEQVQVPAYGGQRLGADAAQLTSGSLIGHGTDLLGQGE
jgi:hypothetical protein